MKKSLVAIFTIVLLFFACGCDSNDGYTVYESEVFGGMTFSLSIRGGDTLEAQKRMRNLLTDIDNQMSLTHDTPLRKFNNAGAGAKIEISAMTYKLLLLSEQYRKATDGAFNISLAPLSELWHTTASDLSIMFNETDLAPPSYEDVTLAAENAKIIGYTLEQTDAKYFLNKTFGGAKLDVGGVAKGYAADRCAQIAAECGAESALINISGNIIMIGKWYREPQGNTDWEIGVTAPRPRRGLGQSICAVKTADELCSMATAGDYQRYYLYRYASGNLLYVPHIMTDTGLPIGIAYDQDSGEYRNLPDAVVSATVISQSSAQADAFGTAITVLGAQSGAALLLQNNLAGIIVTEDKRILFVNVSESEGRHCLTQTDVFNMYKGYDVQYLSSKSEDT